MPCAGRTDREAATIASNPAIRLVMRRRRQGPLLTIARVGRGDEAAIVCQTRLLVCGEQLSATAVVGLALHASITTGLRNLPRQIRRTRRGRAGKGRMPIDFRRVGRKTSGRGGREDAARVCSMSNLDGVARVQVRGLPTLIAVADGSDREQRICSGNKGLSVHLALEPYGTG